jgi:hypothetical protein
LSIDSSETSDNASDCLRARRLDVRFPECSKNPLNGHFWREAKKIGQKRSDRFGQSKCLIGHSPRSRSDIKDYAAIETEVTALVSRVNGHYGEASWTPIRYVNRSHSRTALAGIYRAAEVALVTPLRDDMNIVAKEFVAAQDPENPACSFCHNLPGRRRNSPRL